MEVACLLKLAGKKGEKMLNYKSLKELVYEYLYKEINTGRLKPMEKINENQICKDLNVSRTPIREALIQLENEGYIERLLRRGFIVKEINQGKIREIYEIIGCLEGMAAFYAVKRLKPAHLSSMKHLTERMDDSIEKKNIHQYFELQRDFHDKYISNCGNKELISLIKSLKKRFIKKAYFRHENKEFLFKTLKNNNKQHKELIHFFEKKDKKGAETYLRDVHWNFANANLIVSPFQTLDNF